jgi:spermidine dehydrogenase
MGNADHELGMDTEITRRDFMDGVALAIGGTVASSLPGATLAQAAESDASSSSEAAATNYPPMITGIRGQNPEAINAGHAVRDGKVVGPPVDTGEVYDLVVVGAGMAGLSAAYFYRKNIPHSKVLVIEGCDDLGGHARRNEFMVDGKRLIAGGGTDALWRPNTFPPEAQELMRDIGIDRPRYYAETANNSNPVRALGLKEAMFFSKESFGKDHLVPNAPSALGKWGVYRYEADRNPAAQLAEFLNKTPYSAGAKQGLLQLFTDQSDYMPGVSVAEKVRQLNGMTYIDFLSKVANIHPDAVAYVLAVGGASWTNQAAGPDTFSAWYAWRQGCPGFAGMGLPSASQISNLVADPGQNIQFPDHAANAARLLVRWLIPDALPGSTMDDSVLQRINYSALDVPSNDVRIRLSSTAIRAKHVGDPVTAKEVEVTYLRDGRSYAVRARAVVMACFNAIVPFLCPELPEDQKAALHKAVRMPLVVTNVAIRNWRAFQKLGVSDIHCPGMFYTAIGLDVTPEVGGYRNPTSPDEPIVVRMELTTAILERPGSGLPPREQWKAARAALQAISFETFERNIRSQLDRVLGSGGFEARRDVAGIIINRWGHAYATGSNALYDPDYSHRTDAWWIVGRQRFGRITISNSDAAAVSLTNAAWQQSHRAVNEIITNIVRPVFDFAWSERDTDGQPGDYPNNFDVISSDPRHRPREED